MDILNLFDSEKMSLNCVHSAICYKNKEGLLCFSNSAFSDLQVMQKEGRIDCFWDDIGQDSKVLESKESISYYKTVLDKQSQRLIHFIIQKEPAYNEVDIVTGVITSITWAIQENDQQDFLEDKTNIFQFFSHYIQELKNYYESIIASMPGNVYWLNRDCVLLGGNTNLARMFGLSSYKDLSGLTYEQMSRLTNWNEGQGELFRKDELTVMASGLPRFNVEEPPVIINGEKKYYISNKVPLKNMNGEIVGVLGISLDITEKKLIEQDLITAKEKVEAANRAKTEFLANMSHDMKTPLAGIVTSADVIAHDDTMPPKARDFAAIISNSGKQLELFFTSCLDLSKMEMEEWVSHTTVFSIKKALEEIKALYLPKAISNHLTLIIEYDEVLPTSVEGHRDSLYRVLLNLVGNAIKFTEQGGVTLRATLLNRVDNHKIIVMFQVQDTGIGIPEDKHTAIFEKLYRVRPSYESQIEGSGIGLYIVEQYVKRLGGEVQVKSAVGEGSTFTVILPFTVVEKEVIASAGESHFGEEAAKVAIPAPLQNASSEPTDTRPRGGNSPTLLLVEDAEMVQFITKSLLNSAGFSVDVAKSGEEAVAMFSPGKYDLIYMDIGLPGMSGYDAARAIRQKEKTLRVTKPVPMIALTGHGAVDVQAYCGEAGMQGVLSKPLSRDQAEKVWQYFKEDATVLVPGLFLLTPAEPESDGIILDLEATFETIGVQDIAFKLMATFVEGLKNQFLPQIKSLITERQNEALMFLLHRQLGSLAYVKAPRLEKVLSDLYTKVQMGECIDEAVYQEIDKEAARFIHYYDKMNKA